MTAWLARFLAVIALTAAHVVAARADDHTGPVCVTDGDTLVVNGRRAHGRCNGGVPVRLFGVDAPALEQTCKHPSGRDFLCGRAAASFLLQTVRDRPVHCTGKVTNDFGYLLATCDVDGKNLNALLVREGWALADRMHSDAYVAEEEEAKAAKRGVWGMQFVPPWEWKPSKR